MENLKFAGLKDLLKTFDEHSWKGSFSRGDWKIANGGYDLWFELYYGNQVVAQCVAGKLSCNFEIPLIEKAKLYHKILEVFDHLTLAQDAFVPASEFEEALENGWSEEEASRGWGYFEDKNLPGIIVIERLDDMDIFEDDLEAGQFAKECGEPLFALSHCSYPLNAYYYKDTKENRDAVSQYAKRNGLKISFEQEQKVPLESIISGVKEKQAKIPKKDIEKNDREIIL